MEVPHQQIVDTLADMKAIPPASQTHVEVIGLLDVDDMKGGFYRWKPTSVDPADTINYNVVLSNDATYATTGRWVRTFQRLRQVGPQVSGVGIWALERRGRRLELVIPNIITNASGKLIFNQTEDGTTATAALMTTVEAFSPEIATPATGAGTARTIAFEGYTNSGKTLTFGMYQSNLIAAILGGGSPLTAAPINIAANFVLRGY